MLLLLAVFVVFVCLFPAALYFLTLAGINNRPRPTLVAGTSDFLGLLSALCGFAIVGGPLALAGLHDGWRRAAVHGDFRSAAEAIVRDESPWRWLWIAYGVTVVGAAFAGWRIRRRTTTIYHIHPEVGRALFADVCDRCGLLWDRRGALFVLRTNEATSSDRAEVRVTTVASSMHMTLDWERDDGRLREQIEPAMAESLRDIDAPENPAAGWLLAVATVLFAAIVFALTLLILSLWSLRR